MSRAAWKRRACAAALVIAVSPLQLPAAVDAPDYASATPAAVAAAVTRQRAARQVYTTVLGPFWTVGPSSFLGSLNPLASTIVANLLAFQATDGTVIEVRLEMMFSYYADTWHLYQATRIEGRAAPRTEVISKEALGCLASTCGYRESITASLDVGWLAGAGSRGFDVLTTAKDGTSQALHVPASYVQGFEQALGVAGHPAPAASTVPAAAATSAPAPARSAPAHDSSRP